MIQILSVKIVNFIKQNWLILFFYTVFSIFLLILLFLHICTKSEFNINCFDFFKFVYISDPLEIELVGSGLLGLIVGGIIYWFSKRSDYEKQKNDCHIFFESMIRKDIKRVKKRDSSSINTEALRNYMQYYDNSPINNLYLCIQKHLLKIYEHLGYNDLPNKLCNELYIFYDECNEAHIESEAMDNLLIKIAKIRNTSSYAGNDGFSDLQKDLVYIRTVKFAGYKKELVRKILSEPHKINSNFGDFLESFLGASSGNEDDELRTEWEFRKNKIAEFRNKLMSKCTLILNMVFEKTS